MKTAYTDADVAALLQREPAELQPHMREYIESHRDDDLYTDRPGGAVALWIDARICAEAIVGWLKLV